MGGCLCSPASKRGSNLELQTSMANVISTNGKLRQYKIPINVAQVLLFDNNDESQAKSVQIGNSDSFVYNSDNLRYYIKAMDMEEELEAGQIYFQLPSSRFNHPLTAPDMAALAVKATIALQRIPSSKSDSNRGRRRRQSKINQISPALDIPEANSSYGDREIREQMTEKKGNYANPSLKLQRYSSRRARIAMATRSSKVSRLSTIYEGSVLL